MPPKPCRPDQVRNPLTGRCKKIARSRVERPIVPVIPTTVSGGDTSLQNELNNERSRNAELEEIILNLRRVNRSELEIELRDTKRSLGIAQRESQRFREDARACRSRIDDILTRQEEIRVQPVPVVISEEERERLRRQRIADRSLQIIANREAQTGQTIEDLNQAGAINRRINQDNIARSRDVINPVSVSDNSNSIPASNIVGEMMSQDLITLEDIKLSEFVQENNDHIAILIEDVFKPINKNNIEFQDNLFYECKDANGFISQQMNNTVGRRLVGLRKIGGFGYLSEQEMRIIVNSKDNVFKLEKVKIAQAFVGQGVLAGGTVVSSLHCQPGAPDTIYRLSFSFKFKPR